jgi:hypothetical protein
MHAHIKPRHPAEHILASSLGFPPGREHNPSRARCHHLFRMPDMRAA